MKIFNLENYYDKLSMPSSRDLYIVEYPKSGITWLSTIIANIIIRQNNLDYLSPTFFNLRSIIVDNHLNKNIPEPFYKIPHYRFIKSHDSFNKKFKMMIYLIRHPLDVMNSFFRYQVSRYKIDLTFSDFIRSKNGLKKWIEHTNSWLFSPPVGGIMHMIKYENLLSDTYFEMNKLFENLGWNVNPKVLNESIKMSNVSLMKKSEELFSKYDPRYDFSFIRSKKIKISKSDSEYILNNSRSILQYLGYIKN